MTRRRLPNRRPGEGREITVAGRGYHVMAGFDAAGRPREIFIRDGRPGSAMDMLLDDASVVISIALQSGCRPGALSKTLSRLPAAPPRPEDLDSAAARVPASIIGAAIDWLVDLDGAAGPPPGGERS